VEILHYITRKGGFTKAMLKKKFNVADNNQDG